MKDSQKDDRVYLTHILENIAKIEASFKGVEKDSYAQNVDLQDATFRRIEIIGEAAKNISKRTKEKHPEVKWAGIMGTRDKLIHGYSSIDREIVLKIVNEDIIQLKEQARRIIAELNKEKKGK